MAFWPRCHRPMACVLVVVPTWLSVTILPKVSLNRTQNCIDNETDFGHESLKLINQNRVSSEKYQAILRVYCEGLYLSVTRYGCYHDPRRNKVN